jgi:hypothetical protein
MWPAQPIELRLSSLTRGKTPLAVRAERTRDACSRVGNHEAWALEALAQRVRGRFDAHALSGLR